MMRVILMTVSLLFFINLCAQQHINGVLVNKEGLPVGKANIVISDATGERVLTYGSTDDQGSFQLTYSSEADSIRVRVAHISYKSISETVRNSKAVTYNRTLYEEPLLLDEIVIENRKLRDTMAILTDSLKLTERSTLRSILEKTEGFTVSEDGGITFRGKAITKILVNEKEVFVNQNKIALDNLEYGIMEEVELINNYKDKFNVDFDNFSSSVLNINTKKEFKGVLKLYGDVAYGYQDKFLTKVRGFYFSDALNAFLTSNTNNVGIKEFSFRDVAASFKEKSSGLFKSSLNPYFTEDDLSKSAFDSNTSLTLRKETRKSRLGLVVYYNATESVKKNFQNTKTYQEIVTKTEENTIKTKGNAFSTTLNWQHALSRTAVLSFQSDLGLLGNTANNTNQISNFAPEINTIEEQNSMKPSILLTSGEIGLRSKFGDKTILSATLTENYEESVSDFVSLYRVTETEMLSQSYGFINRSAGLHVAAEHKFSNYLSVSAGSQTSFFNETLNYLPFQRREGVLSSFSLTGRGQRKKLKYSVGFTPQRYSFKDKENAKDVLGALFSLSYDFNESNTITAGYTQSNYQPDLYNAIDTLVLSYNNRLLNSIEITDMVASSRDFSTGYHYSSIIKTQSFGVSYNYTEDRNYLQPIFSSISDNVFYYDNRLIERMQTHKGSISASKGFYLTRHYHLLRFSARAGYSLSSYPTYIQGNREDYSSQGMDYSFSVGFEPKEMFLDEIYITARLNHRDLFLEQDRINKNTDRVVSLLLSKKTDAFEFDLRLGQSSRQTDGFKFNNPFLDIGMVTQISDRLDVFAKGKYLFHLFDFPNTDFTNLNVNSDGNLIYENFNRYNLNYFIVGLSYKI